MKAKYKNTSTAIKQQGQVLQFFWDHLTGLTLQSRKPAGLVHSHLNHRTTQPLILRRNIQIRKGGPRERGAICLIAFFWSKRVFQLTHLSIYLSNDLAVTLSKLQIFFHYNKRVTFNIIIKTFLCLTLFKKIIFFLQNQFKKLLEG